MAKPARTSEPIDKALPPLLAERGLSLRQLAAKLEITPSYLSRAINPNTRWRLTKDLAAAIAIALQLPVDYFGEYRAEAIAEAVRADPDLRDRLYQRL